MMRPVASDRGDVPFVVAHTALLAHNSLSLSRAKRGQKPLTGVRGFCCPGFLANTLTSTNPPPPQSQDEGVTHPGEEQELSSSGQLA
jgi:hypothetical protein